MRKKKDKVAKQLKQEKKKALAKKKKISSTLNWSEVEDIDNKMIILKKGKKVCYVKGVKMTPIDIFIADQMKQVRIINSLRIVLNQLSMPIDWGFCFTPVDMDSYFGKLQEEIKMENDPIIRKMMQSDFDKACWFCDTHREISFEFFVSDKDEKGLYKKYDKLVQEFSANGFRMKEMSNSDYEDYLAFMYENEMINDYYFSRGIFSCLMEDDHIPEDGIEYAPEWELDLLEDEVNEEDVR